MGVGVTRNGGGGVGLLKKIRLPQGGSYELEYGRVGNTTEMPQSRYVLSAVKVTDSDHTGERGAYRYTTNYAYADGYFDREVKEFYGFGKVTAAQTDERGMVLGGRTETEYYNRQYYAKGMEKRKTIYDDQGKERGVTENEISAQYPRVLVTRTRIREADGTYIETTVTYDAFDEYGNVLEFTDLGDTTAGNEYSDDIRAVITYGHNEGAYLHANPVTIAVYDGEEHLLRNRRGEYDGKGALTKHIQYDGEGGSLTNTYTYDKYGNMKSMTDAIGVVL
jgi:YD repeat-containing protein